MRIGLRNRFFVFFSLLIFCAATLGSFAQDAQQPAPDPEAAKAEQAKFREVKSPVGYSQKSIARGKTIYARYCTECHGLDGKAQIDVVANATNLTNPEKYLHGATEGEIFRSIRDGAGIDMPPFKTMLKNEEDMWHMVNFIRSLWPEAKRPELKTDDAKATNADKPAQPEGASHE